MINPKDVKKAVKKRYVDQVVFWYKAKQTLNRFRELDRCGYCEIDAMYKSYVNLLHELGYKRINEGVIGFDY